MLFLKIKKKLKITPNALSFSTAMSDRIIRLPQKMSLFHRTILMLSCSQAAPLPPNCRAPLGGWAWNLECADPCGTCCGIDPSPALPPSHQLP